MDAPEPLIFMEGVVPFIVIPPLLPLINSDEVVVPVIPTVVKDGFTDPFNVSVPLLNVLPLIFVPFTTDVIAPVALIV